jgi:glycosyltransferase involved in cell wall biosynthesis
VTRGELVAPDAPLLPAAPAPRVLLVVDSLEGGGAERYVVDLALALHARDWHVEVACAAGGVRERALTEAGVAVHALVGHVVKRRVSPRFAAALRRLLRDREIDVAHAHLYASVVATAVAVAGTATPLIVTEHTEGQWRGAFADSASRWAYGRAARVVAVSRAIERVLSGRHGVSPARLVHLPNAIAFDLPGAAPALPAGAAGRRLVGRVGRLAPEKGVDVFLAAAARVAGHLDDVHFLVVGDGPERVALEAQARRLRIDDRVDFLGFRDDAPAIIGCLDVLVVSSRSEGAPLVVLEAMQAGVPVVATAVGGVPEQLEHGRDGLLVPPDDPFALATTLTELLEDPARAQVLATAARRRAAQAPHAELVRRVEALYLDALAEAATSKTASPVV